MYGGPSEDRSPIPTPGLTNQHAEVPADSISGDSIFGNDDRHLEFLGFSIPQESKVLPEDGERVCIS